MGGDNLTSTNEFVLVGLSRNPETQILLFVVILLIYSFTVVGNLGIIMLVQIDSLLHTPMYFFLTHLSSLEIFYVNGNIPQVLAHLLMGHAELSLIRCALQMYVGLAMATAEAFLLSVMAYDRFLAICHPLIYATAMRRWRQVQLVSICWVGGFCIAVICVSITFSHHFCNPCCVNHFVCEIPMVLKLACDDTRTTEFIIFMFAAMVILIPVSIILVSYGLILLSVFQMRSTTGLRKAFSTCGSHLTVVIMFLGGTTCTYLIPESRRSPDTDKQIAVFYIVVTPFLNPIIYTLRNKDVHKAIAKVLRRVGFAKKS